MLAVASENNLYFKFDFVVGRLKLSKVMAQNPFNEGLSTKADPPTTGKKELMK
jgi:hypothetical protein